MLAASDSVDSNDQRRFMRYAGVSAIISGVASILYAVAFLILKNTALAGLLLALGGFTSIAAFTALYLRLRAVNGAFALYGLIIALMSALGVLVQGTYTLANAVAAPKGAPDLSALPFQADPRGLLAFGMAGAGVAVLSALILRSSLPRNLGILGLVNAVALIALFLGDLLTGTDTKSLAILIPGGLTSVFLTPAWYIWLGITLWGGK
jgi:hypothetical protein